MYSTRQDSTVGREVAQLVEHQTGTLPTKVRFPGAARDISPRVNFQCRLSNGVRKAPCAIARIHICAHVKDPSVHVRVRWIMETLKHPACTVGWVAQLCRSWLSPGKVTRISYGRKPTGQFSNQKCICTTTVIRSKTSQWDCNYGRRGLELRWEPSIETGQTMCHETVATIIRFETTVHSQLFQCPQETCHTACC